MTPPRLEILAYEPTPLGLLCLRRRELLSRPGTIVTEVTLNHEFLMSSYHTASERALATTALDWHAGSALRVLIGGLGLGYTAQAALASPRVAHVEVVELLPQVIGWLRQNLLPLSPLLNADPRLTITTGDIYARLRTAPTAHYDLILIDVDHSPADPLADDNLSFYSEPGLRLARDHLTDQGILGVWSYAEDSAFAAAVHRVFPAVHIQPITFRNDHIDEDCTDWLFFARSGKHALNDLPS